MELDEAIKWCEAVGAAVKFFSWHGHPRVTVQASGGFPDAERNTFIEAVEACRKQEENNQRLMKGAGQ
ncbi:MAG: hypothetical protein FOGNACKC_00900 [Anaerolineae bacterium]|nr:hypothetical protein [Anaerolineae bacterium]